MYALTIIREKYVFSFNSDHETSYNTDTIIGPNRSNTT